MIYQLTQRKNDDRYERNEDKNQPELWIKIVLNNHHKYQCDNNPQNYRLPMKSLWSVFSPCFDNFLIPVKEMAVFNYMTDIPVSNLRFRNDFSTSIE